MKELLPIAFEAGKSILEIYRENKTVVDYKADDSPLTQADKKAHQVIVSQLKTKYPDIPIISEEGQIPDYEQRSGWKQFWLVDPLDGTKEFIKRSGEFTVNIALIEKGSPKYGIVYVPTQDLSFYTHQGYAWKLEGKNSDEAKKITSRSLNMENLVIAGSRDHAGDNLKKLLAKHPHAELKSMGSSLKFCLVATGEADIYYRDAPTMEWDTAAAHAVVKNAGGTVITEAGDELTYNKQSIKNPGFIVLGDTSTELKSIFPFL